jgi:hypothetical protein
MADILPFSTERTGRITKAAKGGGEIVIFPGVRVEYHDVPPTPSGTSQSKRKRRSRRKAALSA